VQIVILRSAKRDEGSQDALNKAKDTHFEILRFAQDDKLPVSSLTSHAVRSAG
jgi:hypothetical protein